MSHLINYKIMLCLFYVCNDKFNVSRHVGISRLQRSQVDCEVCLPKQNINIQQYIPSLQSTWNVVSARKSRWKKRLQIKTEVAYLSLACDVTKLDIESGWVVKLVWHQCMSINALRTFLQIYDCINLKMEVKFKVFYL